MKFIIFMIISTLTFSKVVIKDEVGLLSKNFIKTWNSKYKYKNKEVHVLIKKSIGNEKAVIYGSNYFRDNDLGGNGSGIVILIVMDIKRIQVITGTRIEEVYTDTEIVNLIVNPVFEMFKNGNMESGINIGILNSIKILDEVIK